MVDGCQAECYSEQVGQQAQAWREALAGIAVTRRDVGLLRRVDVAIAAGLTVAERVGYAER
jgi:hypothetical protein